jgi:hypothetical protein
LGQLQPFIAVLSQECMANLHLLGQPDTCLARRDVHAHGGGSVVGCAVGKPKAVRKGHADALRLDTVCKQLSKTGNVLVNTICP